MRAWLAVLLLVSSPAWADYFPYVKHGPVITGVTHAEAWVAWYTSHYQGTPSGADSCYLESLTGTPNATTPTLLVTPAVNGESVFQDPACDVFHQVHLSGLTPGTAYTFELDKPDESGGSATGGFITAPAPGASAKFSFIVFGDNRNNPWPETDTRPDHEAVVGAILARHADAAFVVNGGDYALNVVTVSGDDRGYTEFFDVERALLATHPLVPAMGNHDSIDTTFYDGLMSAGRFAGSRHPYYWSFDWGQVHLAVLDTFEGATTLTSGREPALSDEQAAWLATDLAAAAGPGRLLFLVTHQGPFSYGTDAHGGSPDVQAKVIPLMLQYGVHAILAGHDHFYERGRESCIDFLVVGAGGAPLYGPDPTAPGLFAAAKKPSYVVVQVDGETAVGTAYDTSGVVMDEITFQPAGCSPLDGGVVDGAVAPPSDAPVVDASGGPDTPRAGGDVGVGLVAPASGCGCRAAGGAGGLAVVLGLLVPLAARRRRAGC